MPRWMKLADLHIYKRERGGEITRSFSQLYNATVAAHFECDVMDEV